MKTSNQTSWLKPLILSLSIACICLTFPSTASASSRNQPIKNDSCPEGMVFIPGGTFNIGDSEHYPSEHVAQDITVNSFCLDQYEVTNAKFAKFVEETDYITVAERPLSKEQFPALSEAERKPGSLVFQMAEPGAKKIGYLSWWKWTPGTDWRHPFGPESNIQGKENYPVVQVAYQDVEAYAK
ncbi:MAG: SUMF1/EgtB/PvdO family nonheme iron enzyme, partial [Cyanobacteria bacterium J06631_2]